MGQTGYSTVQGAEELVKQLYMSEDLRQIRGHSFVISLLVNIPHQLEKKPLDIIVDRVDTDHKAIRLANRDVIVNTIARLTPSGSPFEISIMLKMGEQEGDDTVVFVSRDMKAIIRRMFDEAMDALDFLRESG